MERSKLEKEIQAKLASREMPPSEQAWDRLDAMLSVAEKPKRKFNWLYVAAVFLGFTLLGVFFLNQEKAVISTPLNNEVVNKVPPPQEDNKEQVIESYNAVSVKKEQIAVKGISKKTVKGVQLPSETAINPKKDYIIDYAAKIEAAESIKTATKPAKYIDAETLLAQVQKDNALKANPTAAQKTTITVDASGLLSAAENELNESFRDKVIETINKNYNSVKSSLANRNNQ